MSQRKIQKANTRSKIRAIAKEAFLTQGIEATSTRYLSQKAGIAVGTLFVHFPDKLSLVKDIFFDEMDIALSHASGIYQDCVSPTDYVQQMAKVLFAFYDRFSEFARLVLFDSLEHGGFHTRQMDVILRGVSQRFTQVGVEEKTADIFAENMIANYWFVLLESVPKGVLGEKAMERLTRLNLPFDVSYRNAAKNA